MVFVNCIRPRDHSVGVDEGENFETELIVIILWNIVKIGRLIHKLMKKRVQNAPYP
jgi:hypothetical protein